MLQSTATSNKLLNWMFKALLMENLKGRMLERPGYARTCNKG